MLGGGPAQVHRSRAAESLALDHHPRRLRLSARARAEPPTRTLLHHLLGGRRFSENHAAVVANFVAECVRSFARIDRAASNQDLEQDDSERLASSQARKKGRPARMNSDDESDSDASVKAKQARGRTRKQHQTRKVSS